MLNNMHFDIREKIMINFRHALRKGVTQFVAEYNNQSYEDASEYNCNMINWIISCIEHEFDKELSNDKF